MLIDSHCHLHMLNLDEFNNDLSQLIDQCQKHDLTHLLTVAVDMKSSETTVQLAEQFKPVYASVGVHPSDVKEQCIDWERLEKLAQHPKVIAIGETGLDYYYNDSGLAEQRTAFREHIRLAQRSKKPLIIHSRQASEDTISILQEEIKSSLNHPTLARTGVLHCFTESWQMAQQALDLGFYISFSGIITFKNAVSVQEVVRKVPIQRILIETDAPYLAPVPYRGKTNQPYYVRFVAEKIAELKQLSFEEVAMHTSHNFLQLFFSHWSD